MVESMPADQRRTTGAAVAVLAVLAALAVLTVWWWTAAGAGALDPQGSHPPAASSVSVAAPAPTGPSELPSVRLDDLPPEARETLDLVTDGGPYPYPRDGVVFQNRERLLPRMAAGYYREYTVPTPGEDDRGARRIVTGRAGELYWTADHYASFSVVTGAIEGGRP